MGTGGNAAIKMPLRTREKLPANGSNQSAGIGLTLGVADPLLALSAGRMAAPPSSICVESGEESPGSMEARCRITSGGGDPRDSATESKPPTGPETDRGARVKGCGKSAPRSWQQGRHGKPHREQDRIGAARERETAASRLSDQPPGLVAGGASRGVPQMNGHRPSRGTEPGL
jgi:hypothetical protein